MRFEEFVDAVHRHDAEPVSNLEAVEAIRAVLATLSECLPGGLANDLAAQLPLAAADALRRQEWQPGERLTLPEFVLRVSQREKVPEPVAHTHTEAVFDLLYQAADSDTLGRVRAALPADFDTLWGVDPGEVHMHQPVA